MITLNESFTSTPAAVAMTETLIVLACLTLLGWVLCWQAHDPDPSKP